MTTFDDLHLPPAIAAALADLGWSADDAAVRDTVPTAARGHNLVVVTPPAPVHATPVLGAMLSRLGDGRQGLLLCPESELDEWGGIAHALARHGGPRIQVAHGTARAMRRLRAGAVDLVISSPETALSLLRRAALKADALAALFLAWPESWAVGAGGNAEAAAPKTGVSFGNGAEDDLVALLMQDLPKESQRIIYTSSAAQSQGLVERYARKALTVGAPAPETPAAVEPAGPVRTVAVSWNRRAAALGDLVELLDPASLVVWTADRSRHEEIARAVAVAEPEVRLVTGDAPQAQVVVAFDPPTPDRLRQLLGAGEVVLLVPPTTEGYVARIAAPRRPLRLPGLVDDVTTAAGARRAAIAKAIEQGSPDRALLTLAPLFERHDPAAVAAALFDLWTAAGTGAGANVPAALPDIPATAKVYVGVGKKDGATVNDLVAVLTKDVRVERTKIGKVELRETHSLVELPAQEAERIASALNGVTIRRRRVTARVDRGTAAGNRSGAAGNRGGAAGPRGGRKR